MYCVVPQLGFPQGLRGKSFSILTGVFAVISDA